MDFLLNSFVLIWFAIDCQQEKVAKNYANMRFMQPHGQAHYEINHILSHGTWHLTECLDVLPLIDAQAFTVFFPRLLSRMFVEALIGGSFLTQMPSSKFDRQKENKVFVFGLDISQHV